MAGTNLNRRGFLKNVSALTGVAGAALGQQSAGQAQPGAKSGASAGAGATALSRAGFVAMVSDYFNWVHWSEYNDYAKAAPRTFSDVKLSDKYVKQIECALEERIIGPDDDNRFHPEKPVTRQDASAILALAFKIPASSVADLMKPGSGPEPKPTSGLSRADAAGILKKITTAHVAPVQVMPKSGTTSYRRFINMTCPTPGARIHYTIADDGAEPAEPTASSKVYDPSSGFLLLDNPIASTTDAKFWRLKAIAVKDGMAASGVQSFAYYIARPRTAPFEARLVHAATSSSPAVWDVWNPSDFNRPHVYFIEGSERGVVFDAGQYALAKGSNIKTFVDTLATKPYVAVLGHNHIDHVEQVHSYVAAGIKLYVTPQDKGFLDASTRVDFKAASAASAPIRDGDVLDLGNVQLHAYQTPGHENGLMILQEKKNGWVFGSDMFGCNRPATADITAISGVKMDLYLSMVQQLYTNLRKNGGRIEEVYNAHNEAPVNYAGIKNVEAAVQQLIDIGDSATVPSLRGADNSGRPTTSKQRTSVVGDMWRDKNWIAFWVGGNWGESVNYLTSANPNYRCNSKIDYNAPGGIKKYSQLSHIEIGGGDLVGVEITWAPPAFGIANSLPNKFDPWTYAYEIKVPPAGKTITLVPVAMSNRITSMKLNGAAIKSRASRTVAAEEGAQIKIDIVAPDGATTSNYVFTIRKA